LRSCDAILHNDCRSRSVIIAVQTEHEEAFHWRGCVVVATTATAVDRVELKPRPVDAENWFFTHSELIPFGVFFFPFYAVESREFISR